MTDASSSVPSREWRYDQIGLALRSGQVHRLTLRNSLDAVVARAAVRRLADSVGYSLADQARLSAAVYEIARTILTYAGRGQVMVSWREDDPQHRGLVCVCHDHGLDAPRLASVLRSTLENAGKLNYLSLKRLVDEVRVTQDSQHGNCVTLIKWM